MLIINYNYFIVKLIMTEVQSRTKSLYLNFSPTLCITIVIIYTYSYCISFNTILVQVILNILPFNFYTRILYVMPNAIIEIQYSIFAYIFTFTSKFLML